jgi:prevent-host-death family protein
MTNWAATQAKAKFSEVLDKAETAGPQRIERRKKRFVLLTEEQYAQRLHGPFPPNPSSAPGTLSAQPPASSST